MSAAFVIELHNRNARIVTRDECGVSFFSSGRQFDGLEGRSFNFVVDAGLAVGALLKMNILRVGSLII